jgi:hypothetical protein
MKQNYTSTLFSFFKKSIVLLAVCTASLANAQVANYVFSQSIGTYTPITGTVLASGPNFWDDDTFGPIPIGFSFIYNSVTYTDVGIAANGYVKFGTLLPYCCNYNGTSIQNETDAMHPFSEDLLGNSATCELSYLTSGTPGSQVFTIQWTDWGFYNITGAEINFQVKLYEGTNVIEFAYSPATITAAQTCQVGLTGATVTDFNSRTTTTDWTATTASTLNTQQMTISPTIAPPVGLSYFWTVAPVDMAATTLVAPVADNCYTANETVTVRIQNLGSQTMDFSFDNVTVSCNVTGPNPQSFTPVVLSSGTLAPSATQDVVITTTYDMSLTGTYVFNANTFTASDGNPANDNMPPVTINYGIATSSVTNDTICVNASATLTLTGFGGPLQWQSWDGSSWVNETGPGNNATPYTVNPLVSTDYRAMFCGTVVSNVLSVIVINPVPPTTTGDSRCGYGPVNLTATGVGNMVWYSQPTGGSPLFTGSPYSPTVSATDTFYVESTIGSANPGPLTTTFAAGNGQNGNMFNITALQTITITHFDGHLATGTQDFTIYYRPGTFIGFETDSSTWTNLGTAVGVIGQGTGVPTPIPVMFSVTIPAGQTYGFYVTTHSGTQAYTNGTTLDAVFVQDANIQVREGKGVAYPFGGNFSPRVWNGNVYYTSGCASATRTSAIATVTIADSVVVSASQTQICGLPASATVTLNASSINASYTYTWTGADLNQNSGPSVTATPNATTTYIVTGDDGICADTAAVTVNLTAPPPAIAVAAPGSICLGSPSVLSTPQGPITYTVNSIPYSPIAFSGNPGPVGDNIMSGVTPIGFTFNYFGTNYTSFNMSTNGNIQFGPTFSTSGVPALIPTAATPNNYIGAPWANLNTALGGSITWATLGTAPNRMLVVDYSNVGFNTGGGTHTSQIILYETTNCIEIHAGLVDNTTLNKTMGIEDATGTAGYAPSARNMGNWNFLTPEAWSFCPVNQYSFVWNPVTWLNNPNISNPTLSAASTGNYTYDVTVTDGVSGCTSTDTVSVTVQAIPAAPSTVGDARCGYGPVNLTASGSGNMIWYSQPTGGAPLFTGSPYSPSIGATTTYYVEASTGSASGNLTTTFAGGNGSAGNMFDITALSSVTITHFDAHVATGTHTFEIWYRPGSYVGFETSNVGWTQLGTATGVVAAGAGLPTPVPITFAVAIPAGQTYGFYVTSTTGTVTYTNGTAVGNVFVQDANIQVKEGHGGAYFNLLNNPRVFNGNVYYESGCGSATRTPVTATVTPADTIIATPTNNPMCAGSPVTITVNSLNSSYTYSWTPTSNISNPAEDTVTANPSSTTLYTINALDTAGCATSTTVNLVVNPVPSVAATGNPVTVCAGTPSQLDITNNTPAIVFQVGTSTTSQNTPTTYPAPFGNFWTGDRNQQLYLASELQAAGLSAGPIVSVAYDIVTVNIPAPPGDYTNFTVSIGTTAQSVMTTTFVTGLTQVYSAATVTPVVGWNTLQFSAPFIWDGVSNIVVETTFMQCSTCPGTPCTNFTTNCIHNRTATSFVSSVDTHADFNCGITTAATGTTYSMRPNTRFGAPSDFDYLWTPNVALSSDTIPNPVASPSTPTTYTVTITDNYYNCTATSSVSITVNPLPVVTFSPLTNICIDGSPIPLTGGTPTGGVYSGPGVANNIFYPTVAGVGTHTIVYVYTDNAGCAGTDSTSITVNDLPVVLLPTLADACLNASPYALNTGTPAGGTYSGPGVSAGMFDPNIAGAGIHPITYTYTDVNGCTSSMLRNIVVNGAPAANAGADVNGNTTLNGSASGGTPPYTYVWSPCLDLINCNTLSPFANPQVNTYYVLYVIDANGCYSTDSVLVSSTIGIKPIPVESSGLLVYPNPASGMFNILFLKPDAAAEVTVVNSIGQIIYSSGEFIAPIIPYQINLTGEPNGIYIMHVKYRDAVITSRLVLNK